ncbi:Glycosyl transferase family 2 [Oceanospirillum multiglobuliferum]|uniref:Glycosyltransferase 2-like domain-containing protein n=1 Tax=Oceanospirillum multiglobuliferum TaxID=64969 RepID=A0A1T4PDS2_9GAMM|nr:glycosyltransferase family 2 protein [Oceanospirillum multiglobuliferum]OPX55594.1 hypothetical protein BTE48_08240 [Oceanospirillum multiglobuliferum]SJZ89639.1 Glycosyl transferase family 2 [Oceanospirillum multiglobuliferum]
MNPLISVIMPTWNCLDYLPAAVDSVLSQAVNLELIIVDDGSTDGSDHWLNQLQAQHQNVVVLKGQHKGVSAARNLALSHARGHYVAFIDADDLWYQGKLQHQLTLHLADPELVLSFTDYDHFSEQGADLGRCFQFWPSFYRHLKPSIYQLRLADRLKTAIYEENVIGTSTVMVKTECLRLAQGFDESLHSASDWDLWLRLLAYGDFVAINQSYMGYLVRSNSISRNAERRIASFQSILERFKQPMQQLNPHCYAPAVARLKLAQAENWQVQKGGYWKAIQAYCQACYQLPNKRNIRALLSHLIKGLVPREKRLGK